MTKLISVTARLGSESLDYIKKISKMFNLDKSTAFRNILQKGIKEDKKEKALELYISGKFSIEQAARFADMYLGDFYELMRQKGIESNLTLEDFNESMRHMGKLE
jgi:predicted HTH domain antitoxin